jgi:hypothetical protein
MPSLSTRSTAHEQLKTRNQQHPRHNHRLGIIAELRVPHGEEALPEVDIVPVEPARFSGAQPGDGQQADQVRQLAASNGGLS